MKNNYAKTAYCASSTATTSFDARTFCPATPACNDASVICNEKDTTAAVSFSLAVIIMLAAVAVAVRITMAAVIIRSLAIIISVIIIISAVRLIAIGIRPDAVVSRALPQNKEPSPYSATR